MSIAEEIKVVLDKLATLKGNISDAHNCTYGILVTLAGFANTGLDSLISEIEDIRDEVEDMESGDE